ncbi:MAG: dicarboxylate/amino acid:cation symporter [Oscillospiraceae bacterium]
MKKLWKNYKGTIILLLAIIIGAIMGLIFKEDANVVKPFGTIFINLMLVIVIPLVFLTISTSIAKMKSPKRLGKIMASIVGVFIFTSLIAVIVGVVTTFPAKLVEPENGKAILESMETASSVDTEELNFLERTAETLTVDDFTKLFTKDNLIAIIIFSMLFGGAVRMAKDKAKPLLNVLLSANEVIMKFIKLIMYYAPIGLGCYFASLVGTFGSSIAIGYAKTFILYTIVAVLFFFIVYTLYAFMAGGKKGAKAFWKNIIPPTLTSLATCSSAASIPVNVEASKKIGVSEDIAETIIPLGTSFHKDGSIIGSVFKIMFLVCLFGTDISSFEGIMQVVLVALVANLLITAVPIGGGTISEMMIITMMGYPVAALPILTIIATIIDPPATMLNVTGDTSSSMLAARITDGKKWMKKIE